MRSTLRLFVAMLLPVTLLAHDTWLVPGVFAPTAQVKVRLWVATSEAFPTSDSAVSPDRVARFFVRTAAGTQQVTGYAKDGNFLAADVTLPQNGHAVAVFESKPRAFVLEPKIFNEYIGEEQLQRIIDLRAQRGQSNAPGRERYRKIAKAILCVGDLHNTPETKPRDDAYAKADGLWLEVIPEKSPCAMSIGDSLTFRVLHQGQPLAGAKLAAGYQGPTGHKYPVWLTTDAAGRATVKFDRAGAWYVRTLHMIPTVNDAESDWESAFSTVTFEVRGSMAPSEADAIRAVLTAQAEAWNRGDVEGYMQGNWKSDQLLFVGASGVVRGWQATLERYRTRYPGREAMGTLAFSDLEITSLASDAALVLGRWQLERTRDGKPDRPGGVFTLTLRKFPDGWRIIADHTSSFAN